MGSDAQLAFYRIAQEALNNVSKHAHASRVDVLLGLTAGMVNMVVEDDGIGLEQNAARQTNGLGLVGITERAALVGGTVEVESSPGRGTSVFVRCPRSSTPEGAGNPELSPQDSERAPAAEAPQ